MDAVSLIFLTYPTCIKYVEYQRFDQILNLSLSNFIRIWQRRRFFKTKTTSIKTLHFKGCCLFLLART